MSDNEISITKDGFVAKGEIADAIVPPIAIMAKTAVSILKVFDNIVGIPADYANHHLSSFRETFAKGYEKIPKAQRLEPTIRIGCNVIKNLAYSVEEPEIQKLFANLLLSASDTEYAQHVHPSYASVINEMDSLDAKVLDAEFGKGTNPINFDKVETDKAYANLIRLGLITWRDRPYTERELAAYIGIRNYRVPSRIEEYPRLIVDLINDFQKMKNRHIEDKRKLTTLERKELVLTSFGADFIRTVYRDIE